MLFPDYERVIYQKNPLAEVVCQIRFRRIDALKQPPRDFWHRIRDSFPYMETRDSAAADTPKPLPPQLLAMLPSQTSSQFFSEDELWNVTLTTDFIALTCRSYERWENFKERLTIALNALEATVSPIIVTRLGLRYVDAIQRSVLGLESSLWSALIHSALVGELAASDLQKDIEYVARQMILRLDDAYESRIFVRHGFVQIEGSSETCYLLDNDIYTEQNVQIGDAINVLGEYKATGGRFFRWAITDTLHRAMGPMALRE